MVKEVVTVKFSSREKTYYAIYWEYNGKILDWVDLDDMNIDSAQLATLDGAIREQIEARCDGTALFETEETAQKVIEAIEKS